MSCVFLIMIRRTPRSTRTATLVPYTTLCRTELSLYARQADHARYETAWEDIGALSVTLMDANADAPDEQAILEPGVGETRSEEHTSEHQSLMRISYAVYCLKKNIIVR